MNCFIERFGFAVTATALVLTIGTMFAVKGWPQAQFDAATFERMEK